MLVKVIDRIINLDLVSSIWIREDLKEITFYFGEGPWAVTFDGEGFDNCMRLIKSLVQQGKVKEI